MISGSWITGGCTLSICEGDAICNSLLLVVGVVLIVRFQSVVAGKFDDFVNMFICGDYFPGEEGAPQGFVFLDCLLLFYFQGSQMPFKIKDQV